MTRKEAEGEEQRIVPQSPNDARHKTSGRETVLSTELRQEESAPPKLFPQRIGKPCKDAEGEKQWNIQPKCGKARPSWETNSFSSVCQKRCEIERASNEQPRRDVNRNDVRERQQAPVRLVWRRLPVPSESSDI